METKMVTLETDVPEDVYLSLLAHGFSREVLATESRQLLALRLFQDRALSFGKAAKLAGMSAWDFVEFLGENGILVVDHTAEELVEEFRAVEELEGELHR
jgi:predicted HTH domain antitoxin